MCIHWDSNIHVDTVVDIFTRKHLRYLFLAYLLSTYLIETGCSFTGEIYGFVSFHSINLIGNYREYSCDFLTLILLPVTHPWYAIKRQMRTLSNEPLYEYTRRQLTAKPELTPKVQTWMRNVLLLFYRQLNNERAQTQGQDVRQLSDFILVSRSPKSSLFSRPWRW